MSRSEQARGQWQALVARFERSGVRQAAFAAEAGVGLAAFRYWLYKLRADAKGRASEREPRQVAPAKDAEVRLVPVKVRPAPTEAASIEVDIVALRLRVTGGVDPGYVASLVAALRERGRC